ARTGEMTRQPAKANLRRTNRASHHKGSLSAGSGASRAARLFQAVRSVEPIRASFRRSLLSRITNFNPGVDRLHHACTMNAERDDRNSVLTLELGKPMRRQRPWPRA